MARTHVDPVDELAALFPVDGPHDHERTVAAARGVSELVRFLNYATRTPEVYPGTAYDVIGNLRAAVAGLDQTLRQISGHLTDMGGHPGAHVRGIGGPDDRWIETPEAHQAAGYAAACLLTTREALATAERELADAQVYAGRIAIDTGDDE